VAILAANGRRIDDDHIIPASRSIEVASNARASRLENVQYCGALLFDVDDQSVMLGGHAGQKGDK
jgi:hypothetical protein